MLVKVRHSSNFNQEVVIKISKTSSIARLKRKIKKILAIKPDLQKLYFGGKHLELKNTLYDYKINKRDVIQLMVKNDPSLGKSDLAKKRTDASRDKETNHENITDAESKYYIVGDAIDCIDSKHGAWFEATIKRICIKQNKLMYLIAWDLVEDAQLFYATEELIRPRANRIITKEALKIGEKVMINHNVNYPLCIGFWYDFKIEQVDSTNDGYVLTGTLYIGSNKSLCHHQVVLKEDVYAIEEATFLKNRDANHEGCMSNVRRPIAPECLNCCDKLDVKCTECGCVVCGGKNNPHLILLCDECEDEYHIDCLKPPLLEVPEDDWYCPKCKNDENEIVKEGQLVKKRPLDKCEEIHSDVKKSKTIIKRDASLVPRNHSVKVGQLVKKRPLDKCDEIHSDITKSKTITKRGASLVPRNHRGAIPGVEVGACWSNRVGLFNAGVHAQLISGIHGHMNDCAYSLVLSGNYNDVDNGNQFIYSGAGGHGRNGSLTEAISDQTLTRANKALALNCKAKFNDQVGSTATDWRAGIPVRVIRSYKLGKFSQYAPAEGNRYDGLYKVAKYWPEVDQNGYRIWRYLLKRDDPIPPPWTPEGKRRSSELGLTINNGIKTSPESTSIEFCKKKTKKKLHSEEEGSTKKKEASPYYLSSDISKLIEADVTNSKLWDHCKSWLPQGKKSFLNQVLLSLQCVCCHDVVTQPVTTPCAHNICQGCLEKSWAAGLKCCPTCRFNLQTVSIPVNKKLAKILSLLNPNYNREAD